MKKPSSKVAHNRPKLFFSVLPIGPKPAQITFTLDFLFHKNVSLREFYKMTLVVVKVIVQQQKSKHRYSHFLTMFTFLLLYLKKNCTYVLVKSDHTVYFILRSIAIMERRRRQQQIISQSKSLDITR